MKFLKIYSKIYNLSELRKVVFYSSKCEFYFNDCVYGLKNPELIEEIITQFIENDNQRILNVTPVLEDEFSHFSPKG